VKIDHLPAFFAAAIHGKSQLPGNHLNIFRPPTIELDFNIVQLKFTENNLIGPDSLRSPNWHGQLSIPE
jgi:hypothetical protein